jgi:hypothetical protein
MPAYSVNGTDLTAVGEAIAEKAGVEKPVFPDGWIGAVEGIVGDTIATALSDKLSYYEYRGTGFNARGRFQGLTNPMVLHFYPLLLSAANTTGMFHGNIGVREIVIHTAEGSTYRPGIQSDFANTATNLEKVDLYFGVGLGVAQIFQRAFSGCTKLQTLIIRGSQVVPLYNTTAFTNTPIANGTGYIYVPSTLVEQYKTATNWATFADQIRAIEDYPEIRGEVVQ